MKTKIGYVVAPNGSGSSLFGTYTAKNSINSDPDIDYMYYPGATTYAYYIASPSALNNDYSIMRVIGDNGGFATYTPKKNSKNCFCPIISLENDTKLKLKKEA